MSDHRAPLVFELGRPPQIAVVIGRCRRRTVRSLAERATDPIARLDGFLHPRLAEDPPSIPDPSVRVQLRELRKITEDVMSTAPHVGVSNRCDEKEMSIHLE